MSDIDEQDEDISEWLESLDVDEDDQFPAQETAIATPPEAELVEADPAEVVEPPQLALAKTEPKHNPQIIEIAPAQDSPSSAIDKGPSSELVETMMQEFGEHTGVIWKALLADRQQLDKYIEIFTDKIQDPENIKGYYVEALTSLITTKASTSANASRLLDSMTKMIAATKNVKQDNGRINLAELLGGSSTGFDEDNP